MGLQCSPNWFRKGKSQPEHIETLPLFRKAPEPLLLQSCWSPTNEGVKDVDSVVTHTLLPTLTKEGGAFPLLFILGRQEEDERKGIAPRSEGSKAEAEVP